MLDAFCFFIDFRIERQDPAIGIFQFPRQSQQVFLSFPQLRERLQKLAILLLYPVYSAMAAYADLDVSAIDELPPGRTPVQTVALSAERRPELVERIRAACAEGLSEARGGAGDGNLRLGDRFRNYKSERDGEHRDGSFHRGSAELTRSIPAGAPRSICGPSPRRAGRRCAKRG